VNCEPSIRSWIEELPARGRLVFGWQEVVKRFPAVSRATIRSVISRLKEKGRVYSVWQGVYVIVPDEFRLRGIVPPIEYIDELMHTLGHDYYVGLLSAAALFGAAHQQPQLLMVITDSNATRSKSANRAGIRLISKGVLPKEYAAVRTVGFGKVNVSSPELTTLDLMLFEEQAGGIERAVGVISELAEDALDYSGLDASFWAMFSRPAIQRLGYILEETLGRRRLADQVYEGSRSSGVAFRRALLVPRNHHTSGHVQGVNERWKLNINEKLEVEM
jgi:predicted transcriptional regulator of viral defense system